MCLCLSVTTPIMEIWRCVAQSKSHVSRSTFHVPRSTFHVPRPMFHVPRSTSHVPRPTFHVPRSTFHFPCFTFHVPHPTFHTPRSTFHVPRPTFHVHVSGETITWAWRWTTSRRTCRRGSRVSCSIRTFGSGMNIDIMGETWPRSSPS
jgi:hypothetical protein